MICEQPLALDIRRAILQRGFGRVRHIAMRICLAFAPRLETLGKVFLRLRADFGIIQQRIGIA
jgi:hypothetical protein